MIPGLGRTPGGGNGNPLQYSYLENPMGGGAWWATVHGVAKSQTQLSDFPSLPEWGSVAKDDMGNIVAQYRCSGIHVIFHLLE